MTTSDLFEETYSALLANKTRSGLTMLGIIIGIASVIAMISIGSGAQTTIQSSIQSLGSNLLMVLPGVQRGVGTQISTGRGGAQSLTAADADAIAALPTVKAVSPEVSSRNQVTARGTNTNTQIIGTNIDYLLTRNTELDTGQFISEQNIRAASKVAVIGPATRDDLFGAGNDPINQTIKIKQIEFKIIGVTKSKGGSGFSNPDNLIFIPYTTAQRFLTGNEYLTTIDVQAIDQNSMADLQTQITAMLLERHNISDPQLADFNILNQSDIVAAASSITNTFTILLGSVAGISLVVGGIGIMNMMLTTVTERTRGIGLRKAIGAKKRDINLQFLSEAVMLTFAGGFIGIILGWLIAYLISQFGGISTSISTFSVLLAFGVSAAIGIIFGYYPARRASNLNPIEALRYE
ncbi:MAG: FtsX-like permease family protein [Spirochaetia bacterium]|nr:MAG: FtsX-like permease family protein [Spirochaetia bacterium]